MTITYGIIFLTLGLLFGSFLNVCIYRLPLGQSIVWPSSHCPECKTKIKSWDNIPVISYLFLRGKCRSCKSKISLRYPVVEILTGILFCALFIKFGFSTDVIVFLLLAALLVVISFIDIEYKLILNKITIPGLIIGAALTWQLSSQSLFQIAIGMILGGGLLVAVAILGRGMFGKESMGMGDVKMAAMIGAFVGAQGITLSLFLGFIIAGIFSSIGIALKKMKRTSYIPFGPFIALGTIVYIFFGEQIINWYLTFSGLN